VRRRRAIARLAAAAIVLAALSIAGWKLGWFDVQRVARVIEQLRSGRDVVTASAILYVLLTTTTALGLPVRPIAIAGGAIFGHVLGAALSWTAAVTGSMLGYALARHVGRGSTRRWFSRHRPLVVELSESTSFLTLLRLRLVPIVPLSVVNFTAGLARMHVRTYLAATAIGILPAMIVFTWFADSLVMGLEGAKQHAYRNLGWATAILLLLSLTPVLFRRRAEQPNARVLSGRRAARDVASP
jgi:uncharacterized membrane protein YdjX (TVP38/TMEM64 family)